MITANKFRWEGYSFFSNGILLANLANLTLIGLLRLKTWPRQQVFTELYVELLPIACCFHPFKFVNTNSILVQYHYPGGEPCQF